MKIKNILVTGASGLLGRPLLKTLSENKSWNVTGTAFSRPGKNLTTVDLTDLEHLPSFLSTVKPDVIVHSAAERRPDISQRDPENTRRLNVDTTAGIAQWAAANSAFMIYISTDYVFDGTTPPYRIDSTPHPINSYGESKLKGEIAIRTTCQNAVILRVPILYGRVKTLNESAVTAIARHILDAVEGEIIQVDNWAIRHPTLTDDVADVIKQMLLYKETHPSFNGIFHCSSNTAMTKYEMAKVFARHLGFDEKRVVPNNTPPAGAPRPKNSTLDTSALKSLGIEHYTPFKDAIALIFKDLIDQNIPDSKRV